MIKRVLRKKLTGEADTYRENGVGESPDVAVTVEEAGLITSEVVDFLRPSGEKLHAPVLDIDLPATLIPSTTPGRYHLYLDHVMSWEKYSDLLDALSEAGVIEPGYASASQARGYTAVRLPWVRKYEAFGQLPGLG